jgi:methionyl-tRNA formyltransferase
MIKLLINQLIFSKTKSINRSINILSKRLYSDIKNEKSKRVKDLKVAFFGTDLFSIKILVGLHNLLSEKKIKEINVITSTNSSSKTSKEKLKTSDVERSDIDVGITEFCKNNNIKHFLWSEIKTDNNYKELFKDFDIGLVASFGHLLPVGLIEVFPW